MRETTVLLAELFAYALASALLTVAGAFAELTSLSYLAAGNATFAVWLVVIGAVALYGGVVLLGWREVRPRLLALRGG